MEIVQYFATIAEFLDYSLGLLYSWLVRILQVVSGNVPSWFFTCCVLAVSVGLMRKVKQ